jgi:altronate dehydratase small subunit
LNGDVKIGLAIKSVDNVATVLNDVSCGEKILVKFADNTSTHTIVSRENIPFGFKVALKDIQKGEYVIKYGEVIGRATEFIGEGHLVHVHNVEGLRGRGDLKNGG